MPIHFYAENYLYNRDLARQFAAIVPIQKQLFSLVSKEEIKELDKELNNNKIKIGRNSVYIDLDFFILE